MICNQLAVLFKIVPDPDGNYSVEGDQIVPGKDVPQVPSVFDDNAIEAAVQIKEATQCRVTVFCIGPASVEPLLKRTLAMGADEVVLIEENVGWDSLAAARVLAAALKASGSFDIVLCGREAADTGSGLVGPYVAQALGMSFLTLASEIKLEGDALLVKRVCDGGHDLFRCHPPLLLTVSGEANRPRMPSVLKVLQVKKIPVKRMKLDSSQAPPLPGPAFAVIRKRATPLMTGQCHFIDGTSAGEKATELVRVLHAEGVL